MNLERDGLRHFESGFGDGVPALATQLLPLLGIQLREDLKSGLEGRLCPPIQCVESFPSCPLAFEDSHGLFPIDISNLGMGLEHAIGLRNFPVLFEEDLVMAAHLLSLLAFHVNGSDPEMYFGCFDLIRLANQLDVRFKILNRFIRLTLSPGSG